MVALNEFIQVRKAECECLVEIIERAIKLPRMHGCTSGIPYNPDKVRFKT
jgi:hypothetical protein